MPLGLLLALPVLSRPVARSREPEIRDALPAGRGPDLRIRSEVAYQDDLVHTCHDAPPCDEVCVGDFLDDRLPGAPRQGVWETPTSDNTLVREAPSTGLTRWWSNPASADRCLSCSCPWPVRAISVGLLPRSCARTRRATSYPFRWGMPRSRNTASGSYCVTAVTAVRPS